jgi:hypothetical protein
VLEAFEDERIWISMHTQQKEKGRGREREGKSCQEGISIQPHGQLYEHVRRKVCMSIDSATAWLVSRVPREIMIGSGLSRPPCPLLLSCWQKIPILRIRKALWHMVKVRVVIGGVKSARRMVENLSRLAMAC